MNPSKMTSLQPRIASAGPEHRTSGPATAPAAPPVHPLLPALPLGDLTESQAKSAFAFLVGWLEQSIENGSLSARVVAHGVEDALKHGSKVDGRL